MGESTAYSGAQEVLSLLDPLPTGGEGEGRGSGQDFTWPPSAFQANDPLTAIHRPPAPTS